MGFFKEEYQAKDYEVTITFRMSDTRGTPYNINHLVYLLGESLGYSSPLDRVYTISDKNFAIVVRPVEKK